MKNSHWSFPRRIWLVCLGVCSATLLFAQDGAPVEFAPNATITLPAGWKIISQAPYTVPANAAQGGFFQPGKLLITAAPSDPARKISLSLYIAGRGLGPPLLAGEMGSGNEADKLMNAVLMQGYTPAYTRVIRSVPSQSAPLVTIEIAAKNAAGEERVFTDTGVASLDAGFSAKLYTSRPASDAAAPREITSIIQSLSVKGALPPPPAAPVLGTVSVAPPPAPSQPEAAPAQPAAAYAPLGGTTAPSASAPAPAAATATPVSDAEAGQIVQDYHNALVIVEGEEGRGSGFLCNLGGKICAITNAHVLSGNRNFKLTSLDSGVIAPGPAAVAVAHDIVKLDVDPAKAPKKVFDVATNIDSTVKIGDAVVVPGNAEGAQVVHPVAGKIVGIGPNLIEVDAPFVKGNSGSPIIHVATGKVLGVATYLVEKKVSQEKNGAVVVETRRFGYRIDSVQKWEPINWQAFFAQSAQVAQVEELSDDFIQMFNDLDKEKQLVIGNYKNAALQRVVRSFLDNVDREGSHMSAADRSNILRNFFGDLRSVSRSDILAFNQNTAYDYFRREIVDQGRFRDELYNMFTQAMQRHSD